MLIALTCIILAAVGYAKGDCYPGDTTNTAIVQRVYHSVLSDNIVLTQSGSGSLSRYSLCSILTAHHNSGRNPQQGQTNNNFLGRFISISDCQSALTNPRGYNSLADWQRWAGCHSGYWYGSRSRSSDDAKWYSPYRKVAGGATYFVQKVRFDSQYRLDHCITRDSTGATCRWGWNQSGPGVWRVMPLPVAVAVIMY